MPLKFSSERIRFLLGQLRERLWIKPLLIALLSVAAAFGAKLADGTSFAQQVPKISADSIDALLSVMASSMLVIATLAVASMVSAYASASNAATPRSVSLVIRDDVSQNALSTFVGAFIYSIVALTAVKNDYFGAAGLFCLFALTILVFAIVILVLVRWVDRIARLGRVGATVDKVERATDAALQQRKRAPTLGGMAVESVTDAGRPIYAAQVGYVQYIDMAELQAWAEQANGHVVVDALPGIFAAPGRPLAYIQSASDDAVADDTRIVEAFQVGGDRLFDDDPRFGLVVLAEIAARALSPAINDHGTAIDIVGTLVRLFTRWREPVDAEASAGVKYDRVAVPALAVDDMFDDAFTAIARDGADKIEVMIRLQKALQALAHVDNGAMRDAAVRQGRRARERAEGALLLADDIEAVRRVARWIDG